MAANNQGTHIPHTESQLRMLTRLTNEMETFMERPKIKKKLKKMDTKERLEFMKKEFSALYKLSENNFYMIFNKKRDIDSSGIRELIVSLQHALERDPEANELYVSKYTDYLDMDNTRYELEKDSNEITDPNNPDKKINIHQTRIDELSAQIKEIKEFMQMYEEYIVSLEDGLFNRSPRLFQKVIRRENLGGLQTLLANMDKVSNGNLYYESTIEFSNEIAKKTGNNQYVIKK